MAERHKRAIKPPKKFDPDARVARPRARKVFKLLKRRDITAELVNQVVHIVWPDNQIWYAATVNKLKVRQLWAEVEYTLTGEVEEMQLAELIRDGQLAVVEQRPTDHRLVPGELDYATTKKDSDLDADADAAKEEEYRQDANFADEPDDDGLSVASDDSVDDDGAGNKSQLSIASRKAVRKRGHPEALAQLTSKRLKPSSPQADVPWPAATDPNTQNFLASVRAHNSKPTPAPRPQQPTSSDFYKAPPAPPCKAVAPVAFTKSFQPRSSGLDQRMRGTVRLQIKASLELAHKELLDESPQSPLPDPAVVAEEVEAALSSTYGRQELQYKNRARALLFNLRDTNNPQLRGRVLSRDIAAAALVQLSSEELASKELSQWRSERALEALKNTVLDEESAARFSTAAALAQKQSRSTAQKQDALPPVCTYRTGHSMPTAASNVSHTKSPTGIIDYQSPAVAAGQQSYGPNSDAMLSPQSVGPLTVTAPATDWASVKAEAAEATPRASENPEVLPEFYEMGPWGGPRLSDRSDDGGGAAAASPAHDPWTNDDDVAPPSVSPAADAMSMEQVWQGSISGVDDAFEATAYCVTSNAHWSDILPDPKLAVVGRMAMSQLAPYLEQLHAQSSRRTLSLAILKAPSEEGAHGKRISKAAAKWSAARKVGVAKPAPDLEAYLLPPCGLAERQLRTARRAAPSFRLPPRPGPQELLLVLVHKKDYSPPTTGGNTKAAATSAEQQSSGMSAAAEVRAPPPPPSPHAAAQSPRAAPEVSAPVTVAAEMPPRPQQQQPTAAAGVAMGQDPRRSQPVMSDPRRAAVRPAASTGGVPAASQPASSQLPASLAIPADLAALLGNLGAGAAQGPTSTPGAAAGAPVGAPTSCASSTAMLPSGLDLSTLGQLAAALGVPQIPPIATQPRPDMARDPRRAAATGLPRDPRAASGAGGMAAPRPMHRATPQQQQPGAQIPLHNSQPGFAQVQVDAYHRHQQQQTTLPLGHSFARDPQPPPRPPPQSQLGMPLPPPPPPGLPPPAVQQPWGP